MIWFVLTGAVLAVVLGGLQWLRLRRLVVTVQGLSMAPTYRPGDRVLVRRLRHSRVRTGQVVVVDLPDRIRPIPPGVGAAESLRQRRVIKRVAAMSGEPVPATAGIDLASVPPGHMLLLGDNPLASGDSRQYGPVPVDAVVGIVIRPMRDDAAADAALS
ncbi:S26 family signal peptidase [Jidongwangia harbinensis]|uniref:S26 family signal peptidase n=1 Tax=Jidongwangia harbinensis TaxID=2878561 RepID=UPI001CD95FFD|nr:S26 family signal peptidase [Jidongwangia harbinensis]